MWARVLFICAFLGSCATSAGGLPTPAAPTLFYVSLPDDIYHFRVPVDLAHNTSSCEPAVPLTANQVPPNYSFTFYPCVGRPFNDRMVGTNGVKTVAEASGKKFMVYRGVRDQNGKLWGKVVVVLTPRTNPVP